MRKIEWLLIAITTVLVAIVLPTFNKGHVMDFGTTSDVVIAISNIVMAWAACYAAIKAKDWFKQKQNIDGYTLARELVTTDYHQALTDYSALVRKIRKLWVGAKFLTGRFDDQITKSGIEELQNCMDDIKNKNEELKRKVKTLRKHSFYLKSEFIIIHDDFCNTLNLHLVKINTVIRNVRLLHPYSTYESTYRTKFDELLLKMEIVIDNLNSLTSKMENIDDFSDDIKYYFDFKNT
ncbi:hypothetical protein AB6866_04720 [Rahnella inusitata]|uniref:hypothetical protein n=1 Tax=Rahnella inusitata TaxID=58169 RepID=UPI0039BE52DB